MTTEKLIAEYTQKIAECDVMIFALKPLVRGKEWLVEEHVQLASWQARRQAYVQFVENLKDL